MHTSTDAMTGIFPGNGKSPSFNVMLDGRRDISGVCYQEHVGNPSI